MRNLLIALALCGVLALGCSKKQSEEEGEASIPEVTVPNQAQGGQQEVPPVTTPSGGQQQSQSGSN